MGIPLHASFCTSASHETHYAGQSLGFEEAKLRGFIRMPRITHWKSLGFIDFWGISTKIRYKKRAATLPRDSGAAEIYQAEMERESRQVQTPRCRPGAAVQLLADILAINRGFGA